MTGCWSPVLSSKGRVSEELAEELAAGWLNPGLNSGELAVLALFKRSERGTLLTGKPRLEVVGVDSSAIGSFT